MAENAAEVDNSLFHILFDKTALQVLNENEKRWYIVVRIHRLGFRKNNSDIDIMRQHLLSRR